MVENGGFSVANKGCRDVKNYSEEVQYGHRFIWIPSHSEPRVSDEKKPPN